MKFITELKQKAAIDIEIGFQALGRLICEDSEFINELLLLFGRYTNTKNQFNAGLTTQEQFIVEATRIGKSFMDFADLVFVSPKYKGLSKTEINLRIETGNSVFDRRNKVVSSIDLFKNNKTLESFWKDNQPFFLETFDQEIRKNSVFRDFSEEFWSGINANGKYSLTNKKNQKAVKYHYFNVNNLDMSCCPISVEIKIDSYESNNEIGAGLQYCFNEKSKEYYSFVINNNQQYHFWRKSKKAFIPIYSGRAKEIEPNKFNRIGLLKKDTQFLLFINGVFIKSLEDSNLLGGECGIISMGIGTFHFDNLELYKL